MAISLKVAVIGAGPAGLVAARELQTEGHRVVVYEKANQLGGTWVYDPRVETDHLGLDPNRQIVHSSLYLSLRTNLPSSLMGFSDYPFGDKKHGDSRVFPGHEEVLGFLKDFAAEFGLTELIRFNSVVVRVERVDSRWVVESRKSGLSSEEVFEAVVVCNGHNTEPRVANLPGIEKWPGKQVHSHNYRVPEPFRGQVVVMIGRGPSAYDICREIASVAKEVHLSSRAPDVIVSKLDNHHNMWQHSKINYVYEDGTVVFEDEFSIEADIIFHCTGYKFHFPFLKTNGIVSVEDNRVGPLYKHVFPPQLAPFLSFVGLPQRINYVYKDGKIVFEDGFSIEADIIFHSTGYKFHFPFLKTNGIVSVEDNRVGPLYKHVFPPQLAPFLSFVGLPQRTIIFRILELQSKWVAQVLSSKLHLPSEEEMLGDVNEHYQHMEECGIPKHYTHSLYSFEFDYMGWLAGQVGSPVEEGLKEVFRKLFKYLILQEDGFRDKWVVDNFEHDHQGI